MEGQQNQAWLLIRVTADVLPHGGRVPWNRVLSFTEPLACQEAIQGGRVEILPTAKGSFHVELTQIGMNKLWMQRFRWALPQIATAVKLPDRKVISFLLETNSSNLQHCGREVTPNDIVVFGSDMHHLRSAFGLHLGAMSLPVQDFSSLCRAMIGREFLEETQSSIVRPNPALMSRLLKLHRTVGHLAHDTPDMLEVPEVRRALEDRLTDAMVRCLADGASIGSTTCSRRHDAIIARFEEFLAANPDRPLYLTEICAGIGVAERTLRASCDEHLGMGPIRFLMLRRMHLAHRALLRADPSKSTVTHIVTDHGFWELGRFSVTYRALFGESPSETLRRPAEAIAIHHNRPLSLAVIEPNAKSSEARSPRQDSLC